MRFPCRLAAASAFALLFSSYSSAETFYTQPVKVKLYSKPALNSPVIAELNQGTELKNATKHGGWIKTGYGGKEGFVPALTVSLSPPKKQISIASTAAEEPKAVKLRSRASAAPTVVAGMKGLAYEDRRRLSSGQKVDYDALSEIEQISISDEELASFSKGGEK